MTKWTSDKITELTRFAGTLADAAAAVTLQAFRATNTVDNKLGDAGFDPVTAADRGAEAAIRALIEHHYPNHGIDGEEYGFVRENAGWRWILDPIDGTRAFISGLPTWGTLIGLAYEGEPVVGIIDQPYLRERYVGGPDGTTLNGSSVRTRPCASLDAATLTSTDPELFSQAEQPSFNRLKQASRLVRYGLDCYGYAIVASGHMDVACESGLNSYDMAALIPVIRGAGGSATDWQGRPALSEGANPRQILACGDARTRDEALALLA